MIDVARRVWIFISSVNWEPAVPIVAAILGVVAAILGAYFAASRAYELNRKQEREKFDRDVYQNLYAPILFDVYWMMNAQINANHIVYSWKVRNDKFDSIIETIDKKLSLASPRLISSLFNIKMRKNMEVEINYEDSWEEQRDILILYMNILDEVEQIVIRSKIFNYRDLEELNRYQFLYFIWYTIHNKAYGGKMYGGKFTNDILFLTRSLDMNKFTKKLCENMMNRDKNGYFDDKSTNASMIGYREYVNATRLSYYNPITIIKYRRANRLLHFNVRKFVTFLIIKTVKRKEDISYLLQDMEEKAKSVEL